MNIIHIVEPFWSAWKFYGWQKPIPGIGINKTEIIEAKNRERKIYITIGDDKTIYQISPVTALNLAEKYKSTKQVRFGVKVCVIPQNEFQKADIKGGEIMTVKEFQERYHDYKTKNRMEAQVEAMKLKVVDEDGKETKIIPMNFGDEWCLMVDTAASFISELGIGTKE